MEGKHIQSKMSESLPTYMIPTAFFPLPELPITENGKINRKQLLAMCGGK
jgi:acyl-coenzyme A synthetase/AMP-(fatty) acid ligase